MDLLRTTSCLVGASGLIGQSLKEFFDFGLHVNSKNPVENFYTELLVIAAPSAEKWKANLNPISDWLGCEDLLQRLGQIRCGRAVLFSTVDVYESPSMATELSTLIEREGYGRNRLLLEQRIAGLFKSLTVLRLGGLVGPGLKKNPIYDMKFANRLEALDGNAEMQFLPLEGLGREFRSHQFREFDGSILNITSPPLRLDRLAAFFDVKLPLSSEPALRYDTRTIVKPRFEGGYYFSRDDSLSAIQNYAEASK